MKNLKYLLLIPTMGLIATLAIAQTPASGVPLLDGLLASIQQYGLFALALYETIIRFFPTVQTYSVLAQLMRLIDFLIPDNNIEGGVHTPLVRSLTMNDIKIGDDVRTTEGGIYQVIEKMDNNIIVQTPVGNTTNIGIEDIIEVIRKGYILVDTLKFLLVFIKQLFAKKA